MSDGLPVTLARSDADGFDITVRRRSTAAGEAHELIVNAMFAMDSVDTSSEVALADLVPSDAATALVGGWGSGSPPTGWRSVSPGRGSTGSSFRRP
ncbi:MAG: hypothetical protein M0Z51_12455 [Propionibacterium sp.]|nr:hypothetical protein [Propionibacterium sp.]